MIVPEGKEMSFMLLGSCFVSEKKNSKLLLPVPLFDRSTVAHVFLRRQVFNSMVYGSADPCFALSDKKIKLHILSDPKNKIGVSEIFHSRRSR